MAACKGIVKGKCALVLATLFVVLLSVELSRADGCDQNAIEKDLSPCLSDGDPQRGSSCCDAMQYVKTTVNPSDQCICDLASMLAQAGVGTDKVEKVIKNCVGVSAVPSCMG